MNKSTQSIPCRRRYSMNWLRIFFSAAAATVVLCMPREARAGDGPGPPLAIELTPGGEIEVHVDTGRFRGSELQVSDDLSGWETLVPVIEGEGVFSFLDGAAAVADRRFYRLKSAFASLVSVQPVLESDTGQAEWISSTGGTVSATGTDGTLYELIVPENALLSPERITVTPLQALENLPFAEGLLFGANLAPDGLLLAQEATLRITPPESWSFGEAPEIVAFSYSGTTGELHLVPWFHDAGTMEIPVMDFSGRGAAHSTPEEREAQGSRRSCDAERAARHRIAIAMMRVIGLRIADPDAAMPEDVLEEIRDAFLQWWDDGVYPLAQKALDNSAWIDCAFAKYLRWRGAQGRFVAEGLDLGAFEHQVALAEALIETAMLNAVDEAIARCAADDDPIRVFEAIHWAGFLRIWFARSVDLSAAADCLRFELELVDSQGTALILDGGEGINENIRAKMDAVPLELVELEAGVFAVTGQGTVEVTEYSVGMITADGDCELSGSITSNAVLDFALRMLTNRRLGSGECCHHADGHPPQSDEIRLMLLVNQFSGGSVQWVMQCPDSPPAVIPGEGRWSNVFFASAHFEAGHGSVFDPFVALEDWEIEPIPFSASSVYELSAGGGTVDFNAHWELRHKPEE